MQVPLQLFSHQVGGHQVMLRITDKVVAKLLDSNEYNFYSNLPHVLSKFTASLIGRAFIECSSKYLFSLNLNAHLENEPLLSSLFDADQFVFDENIDSIVNPALESPLVTATTESDPPPLNLNSLHSFSSGSPFNPWSIQCHVNAIQRNGNEAIVKEFLLLEDLTTNMFNPSILDLKMGTRAHGVNSSSKKMASQQLKCQNSTSLKLGVRICGMQYYDLVSNSFKYLDKYHGRSLDSISFYSTLKDFVIGSPNLSSLISDLKNLKAGVLNMKHTWFFSSSLLIIYDTNGFKIKMIDFANCGTGVFGVYPMETETDEGYLKGLDTLISCFSNISEGKEYCNLNHF